MKLTPDTFTLPNGLRVVFVDTKSFPSLTTLLLVGAGSRYENLKNNGIAHFFEHMAFKGSKKYPNSFLISSTIESLGAQFNAFTSKDHTGYWIKSTTDHFPTVIDIISDMITASLLDADEINREKGVICEEINMYEDTPRWKSSDLFEELMYKGSSLGYDIAGTKDTVNSFTRDTFTDYMKELYHPNNAVLVVAGGFDGHAAAYRALIEKQFAGWQKSKVTGTFKKLMEEQKKPQILLKHKKTEQVHFCLGFRGYNMSDPRRHALGVLGAILGAGMSSRLFIQVRERRGLCYYIGTSRQEYTDVGNFVTAAGVTNDLAKTREAIKVTLEEHAKMKAGEFTETEMNRAKNLMRGRMLLALEDSSSVASFFGNDYLLLNKLITIEEVLKDVTDVTREQIVEAAKDVFQSHKLNLSMIGPFAQTDFTEDDLSF
jgi:predicted Zn-dependent peptidase